jgi:expansin (peptidoglycan-binding protein)
MHHTRLIWLLAVVACGGSSGPADGTDGSVPGGDAGASRIDAGSVSCLAASQESGEATYYDADGSGNCSFDPIPGDFLVAALNTADYDTASACGACAEVTGPTGAVVVRIVDRCPGCGAGSIDLSQTAFSAVAELSAGRVDVTWKFVDCPVDGNLQIHFKDGSSGFWTALQIRRHRSSIVLLEARSSSREWHAIDRLNYNYFVDTEGLGDGPYDVRLTDVHGQVVQVDGVQPGDDVLRDTSEQFPACR